MMWLRKAIHPFVSEERKFHNYSMSPIGPGPPKGGGHKMSLSEGPRTPRGPGFKIVRFKMQNSSAQTTACGRDDVFFLFRAEIRTFADAMTLFCSSLDVKQKFEQLRTL